MRPHFIKTHSLHLYSSFLCILLLSQVNLSLQGDHPIPYALSPVYLQYLENVEIRFYNVVKESSLQKSLDGPSYQALRRYLIEYEANLQVDKNVTIRDRRKPEPGFIISSNPILSLQMINRFVKFFNKGNIHTILSNGQQFIDKDALPNEGEVEDAMEGLLRLQYFYDLDAHELSNGILQGVETDARLNARECFELGKFAQESAYFTLALQWFDVALYKLANLNFESDPSIAGLKKEDVINAIKETIDEHNEDYEESIFHGDMYSFSVPIHSTNYSDIKHLSLRKLLPGQLTGKTFDLKDPTYNRAIETNMMALCDGKNLQSEKVKAGLKCYLDTFRHPYWRINPLKVEVLSESPKIIQMYEIFSDSWIAYLKSVSYSELERAPQPPDATPRTAAYAWFDDAAIPAIPVSKTVEFITGLHVVKKGAAEELQVAAYAFGGHVAPHHDSFYLGEADEPAYNATGNQVTTFLVYLNEVEKGGRTAFPLAGISIKPIKNSAVLWYTKLRNGEVDNRTLHAACPVVKGHKWIATKWTRIGENMLKRPCGLTPDE